MNRFTTLVLGVFFAVQSVAGTIDMKALENDLAGSGLEGSIHGAVPGNRQYVFTYRDPDDFFSHYEFSLIPADSKVAKDLDKLQRHDRVLLGGKVLSGSSAQKHIWVSKVSMVKVYDPGVVFPARTPAAKLPDDLLKEKSFVGLVHAVAGDGEILVMEYKDAVVPVFVQDTSVSKTLYRGDKIKLHYVVQKSPKHPLHLRLDPSIKNPIEQLEPVVKGHGDPIQLTGSLVLFPKSPQILFPVYALDYVDSRGLKLKHTLLNDDPAVFAEIRKKLETAWKAGEKTAINGRNCLVNPKIQIRATGEKRVVDRNQANPQIILAGPDDVEILP